MQLYPVVMVAVMFLAVEDSTQERMMNSPQGSGALAAIVGMIAIAIWAQMMVWVWRWRLAQGNPRAILAADRTVRLARLMMLFVHAVAVLGLGWLDDVRAVTGDLVLVDELIALVPVVGGFLATWWIVYPVDRRVQEATLISRLDQGRPVLVLPSRWRFAFGQLQLNVLLLLVPLLLIQAIGEGLDWVAVSWADQAWAGWLADGGTFVGAAVVFICAPLLARVMLNVKPMPTCPMRDMLLGVCERHGVKVREILVWETQGAMINAAVMGLFGRLRYVLMTDSLLELLTFQQVEGVMAHEVGHVKRHHMPWLIVLLLAAISVGVLVVEGPVSLAAVLGWGPAAYPVAIEYALLGAQIAVALLAFGWASRRFERQADTFAAQHLSGMGRGRDEDLVVTPEAVSTMRSALQAIADLNHVNPNRRSWRHGSIRWRQRYLESLVDEPLNRIRIDRMVFWVKCGAAGIVILLGGLTIWQVSATEFMGDPRREQVLDPAEGMR